MNAFLSCVWITWINRDNMEPFFMSLFPSVLLDLILRTFFKWPLLAHVSDNLAVCQLRSPSCTEIDF